MNKVVSILKTLVTGYIMTVVLLLILAFCLYKFRISDDVVMIGIYVIYGISTFCGGLLLAKRLARNRLMWGAVYGVVYFVILCIVSAVMSKGAPVDVMQLVKSAALCIVCGAAGGVIS